MATIMTMLAPLALMAMLMPGTGDAQPVPQRRGDQMRAFEAHRDGALSVREIERRVIPTMPHAQYLGFDFDSGATVYTLKFLRDGVVIWVDVDGRSGQIIGRTGK